MENRPNLELDRPRSVGEVLSTTFELYLRVPVLFIALAAVVVVPWEVILLLVTGDGPLAIGRTGFLDGNLITALDSFLVTPLVSALHVHAVREVGDGERPRFLPTFRQSLSTLPVVALATGISWLGILLGCILIVPGLMLWARWAVVAQTAALEGGGWTDTLRRSANLTKGYRWHALGLVLVAALIAGAPSLVLRAAFGHETTTIASFLSGTAVQVLVRSFEALAIAVLYFDLKARFGLPAPGSTFAVGAPIAHANDPRNHSDADRPPGWYIDPSVPTQMRYWLGDGQGVWSQRTAKTPKPTLHEWQVVAERGEEGQHTANASERPEDPANFSDEDRPPGWYSDPSSPGQMRYWGADGMPGWSEQTARAQDFRRPTGTDGPTSTTATGSTVEPTGHPLDPASYSDEDRPPGWYVIPDDPRKMRYWAADGTPTWGKRKAKTPKDVLAGWRDLRWKR